MNPYFQRILFFVVISVSGYCRAETLADVFRSLNLPNPPTSTAKVGLPISSYALMNEPSEFVIAYYYRDAGSELLKPPLFFLRYVKAEKRWIKGRISVSFAPVSRFKVDCLGSALQISRAGRYLIVDTHLNPSAGCMLVLRNDLTLKTSLYGWYLGAFKDGATLFHNSEVHFAPTHPMQISLYDPVRGSTVLIYPPLDDAERKQFVDDLDKAVPDEKWCRESNSHCDTKQFGSELVNGLVINDRTHSFAFIARFETDGYGPKVEDSVGTRDAVYVYRLLSSGIIHREFTVEEAAHRFGTTSVQKLLTPEMLARIFAKAAPTPN